MKKIDNNLHFFEWVEGRQSGVQYHKMCLYSFRLFGYGFDGYLLWYPKNTSLPLHKDPVKDGEHYRLNMQLKGESVFTLFEGDKMTTSWKKINFFRPDLFMHGLYAYKDTLKLSLGLVKFNK